PNAAEEQAFRNVRLESGGDERARADAGRVSDVGLRGATRRLRGALNLIPFARHVDTGADEWVDEGVPSELIQLAGRHVERAERMLFVCVDTVPAGIAVGFGGARPPRLDLGLEMLGPVE